MSIWQEQPFPFGQTFQKIMNQVDFVLGGKHWEERATWKTHCTDESWSGARPTLSSINYFNILFGIFYNSIVIDLIWRSLNLALKSNLASPMIVLVFEGPVLAVVNPEERPSNIQVCPNHLNQITSCVCTMYTVHAHHIFDSVLYKSDNVIFQYQNIDMRIYQIWYFSK